MLTTYRMNILTPERKSIIISAVTHFEQANGELYVEFADPLSSEEQALLGTTTEIVFLSSEAARIAFDSFNVQRVLER